jgi:hypothetical protein
MAAVLEELPVYGPWVWTEGLMVVTLLVVPAIGASTAVTEPFWPPRPDNGSGVASVCDELDGDGPWARLEAAKSASAASGRTWKRRISDGFIGMILDA